MQCSSLCVADPTTSCVFGSTYCTIQPSAALQSCKAPNQIALSCREELRVEMWVLWVSMVLLTSQLTQAVAGHVVQYSGHGANTADALLFLLDTVLAPVMFLDTREQGSVIPSLNCPANSTRVDKTCQPIADDGDLQ